MSQEGEEVAIELIAVVFTPVIAIPFLVLAVRLLRRLFKFAGEENVTETEQRKKGQSFREKLFLFMYSSRFGRNWMITQIAFTFAAVMLYVVETYLEQQLFWMLVVEIILSCSFAVDYLLFFYLASDKFQYSISFFAIIDLVTILPVFAGLFVSQAVRANSAFLRPIRILRAMRILRAYRVLNFSKTVVRRQMIAVILTFASLVFLSAGFIQVIEPTLDLNFHTAIYFLVVTLTTVGYGEIHPKSDLGRSAMTLMILTTYILMPLQITKLVSLMNKQGRYSGSFSPQSSSGTHVVLCGEISHANVGDFLREFYHEEHGANKMQVVILSSQEPSFELGNLLLEPFFEKRVLYLMGSPLNEEDLTRADVCHADSCFILTDKFSDDPVTDDAQTILKALALKAFAPDLSTYAQCLRRESIEALSSTGIEYVMCVEEMRLMLLGQSVMVPGYSTLITNLVRSYTPMDVSAHLPWIQEYYYGCTSEVYVSELSEEFSGLSFADSVDIIFQRYHVVLMGIVVPESEVSPKASKVDEVKWNAGVEDRKKGIEILMNPGNKFIIRPDQMGLLLAHSEEECAPLKGFKREASRDWDASHGVDGDGRLQYTKQPQTFGEIFRKLWSFKRARSTFRPDIQLREGQFGGKVENGKDSLSVMIQPSCEKIGDDMTEIGMNTFTGGKSSASFDRASDSGSTVDPSSSVDRNPNAALPPRHNNRSAASVRFDAEENERDSTSKNTPQKRAVRSLRRMRSIESVVLPPQTDLLPHAKHLAECTVEQASCKGHVIVCGPFEGLVSFVSPLRSTRLQKTKPVVILGLDPPHEVTWRTLGRFQNIFYIRGTPLVWSDLVRAGIMEADTLVLLTDVWRRGEGPSRNLEKLNAAEADASTIMVARTVYSLAPHLRMGIAELAHAANSTFFYFGKKRPDDSVHASRTPSAWATTNAGVGSPVYQFSPYFASGRVFTSTLMDSLLCQAYWNPALALSIQDSIVGSSNVVSGVPGTHYTGKVFQSAIPAEYNGSRYGTLLHDCVHGYVGLLGECVLPIALYRVCSGTDEVSGLRYVYTNPPSDCPLQLTDLVFVLSSNNPGDVLKVCVESSTDAGTTENSTAVTTVVSAPEASINQV